MPRHRRHLLLLLTLLLGVAGFSPLSAGSVAAVADHATDSPAGDHAAVIAQGVAPLPDGQTAWRVVRDAAKPSGSVPEARALGFVFAEDKTILLTEAESNNRTLLAAGEGAFTAPGVLQSRASLGSGDAAYLRISLVPVAAAGDAGGGDLLLAGDAFTAPSGDRDVNLVSVKLDPNQTSKVLLNTPGVVIALDGPTTMAVGGGKATALAVDKPVVVTGSITLRAGAGASRVLVAVIGAEVPAVSVGEPPTPAALPTDAPETPVAIETPQATQGSSRIVVLTERCPAGVTADAARETANGDACFGGAAVTEMTVTVTNVATGASLSAPVEAVSKSAYFSELAAGDYQVQFDAGSGLGETVGFCGGQDQNADLTTQLISGNIVDLSLPEKREYLCVTKTIELASGSATTGTINATFFKCPIAMNASNFDAAQCNSITSGFDFGFTQGANFHLSDAALTGATFTWAGLPVDGSSFEPVLYPGPNSFVTYLVSVNAGAPKLPTAGAYPLTTAQPTLDLVIYFLWNANV